MKLAIVKTCFWLLAHLVVQKDTFAIATNLYVNKQYKESIKICTSQLNKLDMKDTLFEKYLFLRISGYLESHDYAFAIRDCVTLVKIKPQNTGYYIELSYLYGSLKQYEDCLSVLRKALELNSNEIYILNNLSYYSNQVSKYNDTIKYANEGLKYAAKPEWKGVLLNNRGYGYIGLKRYTDALDEINQAIILGPDNSFAYCYRAIANIGLKRMETVCSDLNKAKSLGAIAMTEDLIKENCKN